MRPIWPALLALCCAQQSYLSSNPLNRARSRANSPSTNTPKAGKLQYLLLTTYFDDSPGSGKVWVVPITHPDQSYVLIAGLNTPVNTCVDEVGGFLYVCDPGQSRIMQFSIDIDQDLVLSSDQVAEIYEGKPSSCVVDTRRNLYFTDVEDNSIRRIDYEDLWPGYTNLSYVLYRGNSTEAGVSGPISIDLTNTDQIYYINTIDPEDQGLLVQANTDGDLISLIRSEGQPQGLAITPVLAYYTTKEGTIWAYKYEKRPNLYIKSTAFFENPRGICAGSKNVYVADAFIGAVYRFPDDTQENIQPEPLLRVEGASGLFCLSL